MLKRLPLKLNPLEITDLERLKLSLFPFNLADSAANQLNLVVNEINIKPRGTSSLSLLWRDEIRPGSIK